MALSLAPNNANLIVIQNVIDFIDGPITDMTGYITIYDETGKTVLEGADTLSIVQATTWNGVDVYYVELPATVQITDGTKYTGIFQSTNYDVQRELKLEGRKLVSQ